MSHVYVVHVGRPSWHQQRAGSISASEYHWSTRADAEAYVARLKAHHPHETAWIEKRKATKPLMGGER